MKVYTQSEIDSFATLEQFRDYFAGIPEERWTTGQYCETRDGVECRCAMYHLIHDFGRDKAGQMSLWLAGEHGILIIDTNDGDHERFQQPTPRARILAAIDEAIKRRDLKV
jgi:hypothetical protein